MKKIAVVTWAHKGFGFEIAKKLAESGAKTIIACKSYDEGKAAQSYLTAQGLDVESIVLDDKNTEDFIKAFRKDFKTVDILINNDGSVLQTHKSAWYLNDKMTKNPDYKEANITLIDNFAFPISMTNMILPLMSTSTSPRIVNIINEIHTYNSIPDIEIRRDIAKRDLDHEELNAIAQEYVADVCSGDVRGKWPATSKQMAAILLLAATRIEAKKLSHVMMNCCVPSTAARVALMPHDLKMTGKIFGADLKEVKW